MTPTIIKHSLNPSTGTLVLPNTKEPMLPFDGWTTPTETANKETSSKFCNGCENFVKIQRPGKLTYNTRCSAQTFRPGGSDRVIRLNIHELEKVDKPFWCPKLEKNKTQLLLPSKVSNETNSMLSDEQKKRWDAISEKTKLKERWSKMPSLFEWEDFVEGNKYHMPPSPFRGRIEFEVIKVFASSIQVRGLRNNTNFWLYKSDNEYKYTSKL